MAPASTNRTPTSVYFGDVVSISAEHLLTPRRSWWPFAILPAVTGTLGWLSLHMQIPWAAAYFWGSVVLCILVMSWYGMIGVRAARFRRRLDQIDREPPDSTRSLAWRMWHRGMIDGHGKIEFDAGKWISLVGVEGPRTILLDVVLPDIRPGTDLSEEIPLGIDGPIGDAERGIRWMQVGLFGLNLVLVAFVLSPSTAIDVNRVLMLSIWGILLGFALYRLGVRPIGLGASSAAPGVVRVTRGVTTREFHRADSVLVLSQSSVSRVRAWVFRSDGERTKFDFLGGANDPGLRQLIERWCIRNPNSVREPSVNDSGARP